MSIIKNTALFLLLLGFSSVSVIATESEISSENAPPTSIMLTPIILTLAIPEADKNNPVVIETTQLSIIKKLEPYQTENIRQYTSLPFLALSVDDAGLAFLKNSEDIESISIDGVSHTVSSPKSDDQHGDTSDNDIGNTQNPDQPCY